MYGNVITEVSQRGMRFGNIKNIPIGSNSDHERKANKRFRSTFMMDYLKKYDSKIK